MNHKTDFLNRLYRNKGDQKGQSIVIIALILVALLLFAGLAVDVGFIFARNSQLQAAVDSAALAGVPELINASGPNDTTPADIKAGMFLNTNGVPITNTTGITVTVNSSRQLTPLGDTEYSITVTWPVELYFLRLLQRESVDLTKSATASINYLADIYASRRVEDGTVSTSTQGIFGPRICTDYGDPFSPWSSTFEPNSYTYQYRIMVPADYPYDILRVELFDPDSINNDNNRATIFRSDGAIQNGMTPLTEEFCGGAGTGTRAGHDDPCVLPTGEETLVEDETLTIDQVNLFWFMRIDENRGGDPANGGNDTCTSSNVYDVRLNTRTFYQLYYFRQASDGSPIRRDLVGYYGLTGDPARDAPGTVYNTDLRWVSPGADHQGNDFPNDVDGFTEVPAVPFTIDSFEINLNSDVPSIVVDPSTGARYIYLDVTAESGASENGFEIWAGPPIYAETTPSDVNARNLLALNQPGSHNSQGVAIFALGRLPMNSIYTNPVDIPLVFIGPEQAGETVTVSLFDSDAGADPPITFFFDSIYFDEDDIGRDPADWESDWMMIFGQAGVDDPDGETAGTRCIPGSCQSQWVNPPYRIIVPGITDNCDYQNPNAFDCTPFYGGRLMARYQGGQDDTFGWEIRLNGLPRLVR